MKESSIVLNNREIKLTNLDKVMWPEGLTKAHLIKYYSEIAPYILPYLYNRPVVLKRYPHGLQGEPFYQKDCPAYAPPWIKRYPVEHTEKVVNYILCNDLATLLWMVNQSSIEIHAWLARIEGLESPDLAVMDLDPTAGATFADVLEVAVLFRETLKQFVSGFQTHTAAACIFYTLKERLYLAAAHRLHEIPCRIIRKSVS